MERWETNVCRVPRPACCAFGQWLDLFRHIDILMQRRLMIRRLIVSYWFRTIIGVQPWNHQLDGHGKKKVPTRFINEDSTLTVYWSKCLTPLPQIKKWTEFAFVIPRWLSFLIHISHIRLGSNSSVAAQRRLKASVCLDHVGFSNGVKSPVIWSGGLCLTVL